MKALFSWIRSHAVAAEIAFGRLTEAARKGRSGLYQRTWGDLLLRICLHDLSTISLVHGYEQLIPLQDMEPKTLHAEVMNVIGFVRYVDSQGWGEQWNDHNLSDHLESLVIFLGEKVNSGWYLQRYQFMQLLFVLASFVFFIAYDNQHGLATEVFPARAG